MSIASRLGKFLPGLSRSTHPARARSRSSGARIRRASRFARRAKSVRFHRWPLPAPAPRPEKSRARKSKFVRRFKPIGSSGPPAKKYFASVFQKYVVLFSPSRLEHRGAYRDRHERGGGMRWTRRCRVRMRSQGEETRERSREARETSGSVADGQSVWSWHPLLVSSFAEVHSSDRVQ